MYHYQFPPTGSYYGYNMNSYPKGFPFAQNFGNTGMAYDERVQSQYYPNQQDQQSGSSLRDSTGKQSNQGNTKSSPNSQSKQSNPQMEGNFSQGDYYEPYSHLMSGPPFYPAPVNQSYHPQSQQSGGSRGNY